MITLYGSGRRFGLPDGSPFVSKVEVLLKMCGAPYELAVADFGKAPKGKIPYIGEDGQLLGDSTFIRFHLERKFGFDFDQGLMPQERATAWAYEKMCEDHLYWGIVHSRWAVEENFDRGPRSYFDQAPAPMRPFVIMMVKRGVRASIKGQGFGRHSKAEIEALSARDLDAISVFLDAKPWLMGDKPCGADSSVWSMVAGALCPVFETQIRTEAEKHPNLVAYRDRGMQHWFPELVA